MKNSQQRCYLGAEHTTSDLQFYYKTSRINSSGTYTVSLFKKTEAQNSTSPED